MHFVEPDIFILSRPTVNWADVERWLTKHGTTWEHQSTERWPEPRDADLLVEFAGRQCYQSFGSAQFRKESWDYVRNILSQEHGSVLEHATWTLLIEGVSRSLTHEFIRHRAGFAYSQLSQRYVDERDVQFVRPPGIEGGSLAEATFVSACNSAQETYATIIEDLKPDKGKDERIRVRQAARSVLPNATETKIVVTANARAWRHFIELRGSEFAEPEIRRLAVKLLEVFSKEAPLLFDGMIERHGVVSSQHKKV